MYKFRSSPGGDAPCDTLTTLSWISQTVGNVPHSPNRPVSISVLVSVHVDLWDRSCYISHIITLFRMLRKSFSERGAFWFFSFSEITLLLCVLILILILFPILIHILILISILWYAYGLAQVWYDQGFTQFGSVSKWTYLNFYGNKNSIPHHGSYFPELSVQNITSGNSTEVKPRSKLFLFPVGRW